MRLDLTEEQLAAYRQLMVEARARLEETQTEAARGSGVPQATISALEWQPRISTLLFFQLLDYYRIEPNEVARVFGLMRWMKEANKEGGKS